ncbi:hypothetical protein [Winogradskyella rapida]|uniref:Uncharacterized protein n=1 Tax=Winogradskyella rapida TaxID=549701 RepID=A0ABW3KWN6_9FLAO
MKLLYTSVFLLLTTFLYGQKSVLLKNNNSRALELRHYLNTTQDSIVFEGERTIYEVMIFNDDFERIIKVKDSKAKLLIGDIPVGRYAIEAVLRDKLIVITLLRHEIFSNIPPAPELQIENPDLLASNSSFNPNTPNTSHGPKATTALPDDLTAPKTKVYGSENARYASDLRLAGKKANVLNSKHMARPAKPKVSAAKYWIHYKVNNGSSSETLLKMADQKTVDRLILKIETDMKTTTGRNNELTVWQVYDPTNFFIHKRRHKKNYMNVNSDSFDIQPYYKVTNALSKKLE